MNNTQVNQALFQICQAVIESVELAGDLGAPAGHLYAALMTVGCSLDQFESIMSALVKAGKLRRSGDLYFKA